MEGIKPLSRSGTGHAAVLKAEQVNNEFKRFQEQQKNDPSYAPQLSFELAQINFLIVPTSMKMRK
jgi:hypothetical protein